MPSKITNPKAIIGTTNEITLVEPSIEGITGIELTQAQANATSRSKVITIETSVNDHSLRITSLENSLLELTNSFEAAKLPIMKKYIWTLEEHKFFQKKLTTEERAELTQLGITVEFFVPTNNEMAVLFAKTEDEILDMTTPTNGVVISHNHTILNAKYTHSFDMGDTSGGSADVAGDEDWTGTLTSEFTGGAQNLAAGYKLFAYKRIA